MKHELGTLHCWKLSYHLVHSLLTRYWNTSDIRWNGSRKDPGIVAATHLAETIRIILPTVMMKKQEKILTRQNLVYSLISLFSSNIVDTNRYMIWKAVVWEFSRQRTRAVYSRIQTCPSQRTNCSLISDVRDSNTCRRTTVALSFRHAATMVE